MEELKTNVTQISLATKSEGKIQFQKNGIEKDNQRAEPDEQIMNLPEEGDLTKRVHRFYFVKFWPSDVEARIEEAEKLVEEVNQEAVEISEKVEERMLERGRLLSSQTRLQYCGYLGNVVDSRRKELDLLLYSEHTVHRSGRPQKFCSSSQELDKHKLHFRMLHGTNSLAEEKRLLKETINANPPKTSTGGAMSIRNSLRSKQATHDDVKLLHLVGKKLDEIRKEVILPFRAAVKKIEKELQRIEEDMKFLDEQLRVIRRRKAEAYERILQLRELHSEESSCYYQNLPLQKNARKLAKSKNVAALEELSQEQVDRFLSQWNDVKTFRDEYTKRVLPSLDYRKLTEDGRRKNSDENPHSSVQNVRKTAPRKQNGKLKWHMKNAKDPPKFALMAKRMQQHIKYVNDLQQLIPLLGRYI